VSSACASESVGPPPAPPVNWASFQAHRAASDAGSDSLTARERDLGAAYAAALAAPDLAPLGAALDDDSHFTFPGADDVRGRSAIVHAHDVLLGAFEGRHVVTTRIFRTSREQTVEWTMTGSQARDWMGIAATRKPVVIQGLSLLFTRDDGLITDIHTYFDVAVVKAELGVGPKELVLAAASLVALAGADGDSAPAPEVMEQSGSPDEKANVAVLHGALDALENGAQGAYEAAFAEDVQIFTRAHAQPTRGKAEVTSYFKAIRKAIGQLDTTVTDGWGIGSFAVTEYTITGEQRAALGWLPAQSDKAIRLHVVDVAAIAGGKIARLWRYENPAEALVKTPGSL
jgi:ketosteroid isomerase-like protein